MGGTVRQGADARCEAIADSRNRCSATFLPRRACRNAIRCARFGLTTTPPSRPNRIVNLLQQLDMMDRFVKHIDNFKNLSIEVDFRRANYLLDIARRKSLQFIENAAMEV